MWMSFFPALKQLVTIYNRGNLGAIRSIKADFCIKLKYDSSSRLWNKKLAGGAAWDLGIYNLNLLHLFFNPDEICVESITKELSPSGVDQHNQIIFNLPKRGTAELNFSLDRELPQDAYIEFENGSCKIPNFFHTDEIIWEKQGETVTHKFEKNKDYHYQIDAFIKAIQQGEVEVKENNFKMTSDRIKWIEEYLELEVQAIEGGY
jgi:predicted dehydrogenase